MQVSIGEKGDKKEHREQAAPNKPSPVSEQDTAEPNSTTVVTPDTLTDDAEHPSAHDRLRDACKAVLAEGGASGVLDIIRELMPDLAIILADVEVPDLITELEARGPEAAEEGLLRLVRKWADTSGMQVIVRPKKPATTAGESAPDAVAEAAAPDAVAEPNAPETDDDSGVDANTDAPDDEDTNQPEPTPDGSSKEEPRDETAEAGPETEPSERATSTDRSDAPTATVLEMPPAFKDGHEAVAWAEAHHLELELDPNFWPSLLRDKIGQAVIEHNRDAANAELDDAEATNSGGEPEDT